MKEKTYSEMVTCCLTNVYTLSKNLSDAKYISLSSFDLNDDGHKAFLTICNYVSMLFKEDIYIDLPLLKFLKVKKYFKNINIKKAKRKQNKIDIPTEIAHICNSFSESEDSFKKIWKEFYSRKDNENE